MHINIKKVLDLLIVHKDGLLVDDLLYKLGECVSNSNRVNLIRTLKCKQNICLIYKMTY
jgi:hypothetical protein